MPGENVFDWSVTASNNGNSDSSINWLEGQPRASVNNSSRSEMAAIAKWRDLQNGSIVTSGTANAQLFTSGNGYTTIPTGMRVLLKVGAGLTNTGAATLNMDSIGATAVKYPDGSDLQKQAFVAGSYVELVYGGATWVLLATIPEDAAAAQPPPVVIINNNTTIISGTPVPVVDFTTGFDADHYHYTIEFYDVVADTEGVYLAVRCSADAGVTFDAASHYAGTYAWSYSGTIGAGGGGYNNGGAFATYFALTSLLSSNSRFPAAGHFEIWNPLKGGSPGGVKPVFGKCSHWSLLNGAQTFLTGGVYTMGVPEVPVNAIRFLASAGNLVSGHFNMFATRIPT